MNAVRVDGTAAAGPVDLHPDAVYAKARTENFPVALRFLPQALRDDLTTVYGYARLVDDIGDLSQGDRLAELDWVEAEFERAASEQGVRSDHRPCRGSRAALADRARAVHRPDRGEPA